MQIHIHSTKDFAPMRKAGKLAAEVLDYISDYLKPGVTTNQINDLCHQFIVDNNAIPAPLGYKGFPKSICTSINHVVCHGIPDDKPLKSGDIINIDVSLSLNGWYGDTSRMFIIETTNVKAAKLVTVTYEAMMHGINAAKPGATLGDVGYAIESHARRHNFSIVHEFCGHGIGQKLHEPPDVLHYGRPGEGLKIVPGMFFTIEPMINAGKSQVIVNRHDGWTVTTRDRSLSAQFEHTIGINEEGAEIFTLSPQGMHLPHDR